MSRIFLIVAFLFLSIGGVQAQRSVLVTERDVTTKRWVDTCVLSVHYLYRYSQDTLHRQGLFDRTVLDIGKRYTHYYSANADRIDSAAFQARWSSRDAMDLCSTFASDEQADYVDIYSDFPARGQRRVATRLWETDYEYEEPIRDMEWEIHPSAQKTISGYVCHRATGRFRGRTYDVWYAPEIPISCGPWKFGGLPGLILSVQDREGLFSWQVTGIEQPDGNRIWIYDPAVAGDFGHRTVGIARKEWLRLEQLLWKDRAALMQMLQIKTLIEKNGRYVAPQPGDITIPYIPPLELE